MTTVLVVDDEPIIATVLVAFLESEGYTAHTAVGGAAIPLALDERPDVILLDLDMPGMDGIEVARRLKADPRTRAIPIALMSAAGRLAEPAPAAAADALLPKPFDLDRVLAVVDRLAGGEGTTAH
jgi:CheY-like chemotaxis protein